MQINTIPLRAESSAVYLEAYLLHHSDQFQVGARRPAVIICPGGGYIWTSDREAEPIAMRFLARGYNAFVLRYSVRARFPEPMLDLAQAILAVRAHADEWLILPDQVAVCGFSAGGHLAAALGVLWDTPLLREPLGVAGAQIRPDALILGYPVIDLDLLGDQRRVIEPEGEEVELKQLMYRTVFGDPRPAEALKDQYRLDRHVSPGTPPTFLWHTAADDLVLSQNALRFAAALAEHRVPYELHVFESGVHGLALADEVTEDGEQFINPESQVWVDLALAWLRRRR